MTNPIKLSIYIPTYNRVTTLLELINTLKVNIKKNEKEFIEIVVCDNASSDLTFDMMKQALDHDFIDSYIRRSKNLGADINILDCFKYTHGDFIWLLCDDDLPTSNAIDNILKVIDEHGKNISMIYLNRSIELMSGEVINKAYTNCDEGIEKSPEIILNTPGHDLLTASTLVLKRQSNDKIYSDALGKGYLISPLTLALNAIHKNPIYLFKEPQLRYREGDKSSWLAQWPTIIKVNVPRAFNLFCDINNIDKSNIDKFITGI